MFKKFKLSLRFHQYAFYLLVICLLSACKKENPETLSVTEQIASVDKQMLTEILYLPTSSSKKIAFSSLSPIEKAALFKLQFEYILKEIPINEKQTSFIKELSLRLSPDIWSQDNEVRKAYKATYRSYEIKALELFSRDFLKKYFAEIITPLSDSPIFIKSTLKGGQSLKGEQQPAICECSAASDWCSIGKACQVQLSNVCSYRTDGCGFLLNYACNGKCYPIPD